MRKTNGDYIMDKRSYDRNESIDINGKMFHFTPDRKEFLATLAIKVYKSLGIQKLSTTSYSPQGSPVERMHRES